MSDVDAQHHVDTRINSLPSCCCKQELGECAKAGGFFTVPFCLEGSLRDERALRSIEHATATTICLQVVRAEQSIVVLILPGAAGRAGNVKLAVQYIRGLRTSQQLRQYSAYQQRAPAGTGKRARAEQRRAAAKRDTLKLT